MLWFPLLSQSEGRKESAVVMEVFIWQPHFVFWGFIPEKPIFAILTFPSAV